MSDLLVADYEDCKVLVQALELKMLIELAVPNFNFVGDRDEFKWRGDGKYAQTINQFMIYHESTPNIPVGKLGVDFYSGKFFISNDNIKDGRSVYRHTGQYKESKHIKNIVRIAKKTLAPYTFTQVATKSSDQFNREVSSIYQRQMGKFKQSTQIEFMDMYKEVQNILASGYKPTTTGFKRVVDFISANREDIDKYWQYDPAHYFVWINNHGVEFKRKDQLEPTHVANRDELPDEIKGKMAILDITDTRSYIEEVGFKENDSAYWVFA
jgi:hypothetical protein